MLHVIVNVLTENSGFVFFRSVLVLFSFFLGSVVSGESSFLVRDVDTSVAGSLEDSEDSVTSGSSD